MHKISPSRQPGLNWSKLTNVLAPLSLGVALLTLVARPATARPVVIVQPPLPSTSIIGSPIPSPVPVNPYTGNFCAFSSYECRNYDTVIIPGRQVIQSQTLINPTVINSRRSSVLVNPPVIINSPRYPQGTYYGGSSVIYGPSGGLRIRVNP